VIDALFGRQSQSVAGITGLVSFGHVAYFGIGAYVHPPLQGIFDDRRMACRFVIAFPRRVWGRRLLAGVRVSLRAAAEDLFRHADIGVLANRSGDLFQNGTA